MAFLSQSYQSLDAEDYQDKTGKLEAPQDTGRKRNCSFPSKPDRGTELHSTWLLLGIFFLVTVVILIQTLIIQNNGLEDSYKQSHTGLSKQYKVERVVYLPSKYTLHNRTQADLAWRSILPGHGFVAVDFEWAKQRNLPKTMKQPGHEDKLLYVLEAYHAIHCTRILRNHYLALLENRSWNWSFAHDMHCFDALRQYIMCNPDDSLLYTTGHRDTGHGQTKKCQDWDALRDWAEERTASYFDDFDYVEGSDGKDLWNNYHRGDGLPVGSL